MATSSPEKRATTSDNSQLFGGLVGNIQSPPHSAYGNMRSALSSRMAETPWSGYRLSK